jgi:hypothetical protein
MAVTLLLGGSSAYAQSTTTIHSETTVTPPEKEVQIEKEKEIVPVPVPVEVPAKQEEHSANSSSSTYSNKTVKEVVPAQSKATTTTRRKQISYRPAKRQACAKQCTKTTSQSQPATKVIEKNETYSHNENNNSNSNE